jgi:hypothetical protein
MLMNVSCVMFARVVPQVLFSGLIIESKESLCFTIKEPEIPRFHSSWMLSFDGVVNNANGSGVVNVYGSWWLWMTKFFKDKLHDFGLLCI